MQDQDSKFVDEIVDLLEKRNLINTKNKVDSKPKVSKILQTLLKSHLKNSNSLSPKKKDSISFPKRQSQIGMISAQLEV